MADIAFTPAGFVAGDPAKGARPSALTAIETVLNQIAHKASRGSGLLDADLVGGRDVLAQTPLNSGLVCAPQANVPEWPDNAAGTTYFQDVFATLDGWAGTRCTIDYTTKPGTLIVTATAANPFIYRAQWSGLTGKTIKAKIKRVSGSATHARFSNNTGTIWSQDISYDGLAEKIFSCVPSNEWFEAIYPGSTGSANLDVYEISFIYIGDGTYTTKALDASGNGNHGTVYGATPVDTVAGKGFDLGDDTDSKYIALDVTKNNFTGAFAFSCWVQGKARSVLTSLFTRRSSAAGSRGINTGLSANNRPDFYISGDGTNWVNLTADAGSECTADCHLVFVFIPSASMSLYKNGVLIKSLTIGVPASIYYDAIGQASCNIGTSIRNSVGSFSGWIADPRIYNRALSAEEVWELYQKPGMARLSGPIDAVTAVPDSRVVRSAAGGISFRGAQASTDAQELDAYEEGTWTPAYTNSTPPTTPYTMDIVEAKYTKIGRLVTLTAFIRTDSVAIAGAAGSLKVSGLPFVPASYASISVGYATLWAGDYPSAGYILTGESSIYLVYRDTPDGTVLNCDANDLTTGATADQNVIILEGHYYV